MDLLTSHALTHPDRPALIWEGHTLSYRDLEGWAAALEAGLARRGITSRPRVAALLPREPVAVAAVHALARLGAVLVPLNLRLTPEEMAYQIARSGATHVLATPRTVERARAVAGGRQVVEMASEELGMASEESGIASEELGMAESPAPRHSPFVTRPSPFAPRHSPLAPRTPHPAHRPSHPALDTPHTALLFTSGTTGRPKAAMLTAANFYHSAGASAQRLGVQEDDRWLLTLPLYHVGGLSVVLRSAFYGTAVVLPPPGERFDPLALDAAVRRHRVTLVSLVPTQLYRWLQAVPGPPPSHLRLVLLGGAAAPEEVLHEALRRGYPVALTYGLTEAASQVATAPPDLVRRKPGTVGPPLPGTRVRIVDPAGRDLPPGTIGEIVVQGPTVFAGYLDDPQATAAALRDGWLHTGDLGYLDAEGHLWVVNRRSDLIVTGGENVYPAEVEAVLRRHPEVAEACVVGVDDPEWGQRVAAAVVLRPGATATVADLEAHCRRHLAGYKVPRRWRLVPDLPRTASGKVRRPAVRALLASEA